MRHPFAWWALELLRRGAAGTMHRMVTRERWWGLRAAAEDEPLPVVLGAYAAFHLGGMVAVALAAAVAVATLVEVAAASLSPSTWVIRLTALAVAVGAALLAESCLRATRAGLRAKRRR